MRACTEDFEEPLSVAHHADYCDDKSLFDPACIGVPGQKAFNRPAMLATGRASRFKSL